MSERLKEHAWKVCIRQRIEGSNPSLTANISQATYQGFEKSSGTIFTAKHPKDERQEPEGTSLSHRHFLVKTNYFLYQNFVDYAVLINI